MSEIGTMTPAGEDSSGTTVLQATDLHRDYSVSRGVFRGHATLRAVAGASFSLMDRIIFQGTFLGWILRSPERIPKIFPFSPKWRFVLFGLSTIAFAKHPEGLVENGKRNAHARMAKLQAMRDKPRPDEPDAAVAAEEALA